MTFLRVIILILTPTLCGFSDYAGFDRPTNYGGGGGYSFTGSPANHGMECTECHESVRTPKVSIISDPPGLFENGYETDIRYKILVNLLFETRGLENNGNCSQDNAACNRNLFVAEFVDLKGQKTGVLCPDTDAILNDQCESELGELTARTPNGNAIAGKSLKYPNVCDESSSETDTCIDLEALADQGLSPTEITQEIQKQVRGRTHWEFSWRSPPVGSSPVRFFLGLVDGDGGTRQDPDYADYYGDAVYMTARIIPRSDTLQSPALTEGNEGCGATPSLPNLLLIFLASVHVGRRRRA